MYRSKKKKIIYADGYNHLSHRRNILVNFYVNESEKAAMDDLMGALGVTNQSEFIRKQVFKAYNEMTPEQLQKMKEVAEWRVEDARLGEKSQIKSGVTAKKEPGNQPG